MSTTTVLFPPPLRHSKLEDPIKKYFLTLQNLHPLIEVNTTKGAMVETLPPAGLDEFTGQSNQNAEYTYILTAGDGTVTIDGADGGPVVLTAVNQVARFKSNGVLWRRII